MTEHERCRTLVLEADPAVDTVLAHLSQCAPCRELADRVTAVRRAAAGMATADAPPAGLADRATAAARRPPSRRGGRVPVVAAAIGLAAAVVAAVMVVRPSPPSDRRDASNLLLASAQRVEDAGTALLTLEGQGTIDGVEVSFGGSGSTVANRSQFRGVARRSGELAPFEIRVVDEQAWTRASDGSWRPIGAPSGPLDAVVLDAGSVIELLRRPKRNVRLSGDRVQFTVTAASGIDYVVEATIDAGSLLRWVTVSASGRGWQAEATLRPYGFGVPVAIHPPPHGTIEAP